MKKESIRINTAKMVTTIVVINKTKSFLKTPRYMLLKNRSIPYGKHAHPKKRIIPFHQSADEGSPAWSIIKAVNKTEKINIIFVYLIIFFVAQQLIYPTGFHQTFAQSYFISKKI